MATLHAYFWAHSILQTTSRIKLTTPGQLEKDRMKEEKAVIPILTGIVMAMIASHITPWDHPTADAAEFTLLFASVAFILLGIFTYCSMTAQNSKSIARQMLELEEVVD